ncbi:MAG TPA: preprotein translocase subunit YajC [Flavipsychrobacter sp.]|nr:preprotein translocase subunit YajC [Flavipsychrobacter sp.]
MNLLNVMLQAQPGGASFGLLFMGGMLLVMYFFMIRPQAKRAKEQKKFAESINSGEQIVTSAGIHGRINRINEDGTLQIEISRGTFMTVERSAISMELTNAYRKKAESADSTSTTAATTK